MLINNFYFFLSTMHGKWVAILQYMAIASIIKYIALSLADGTLLPKTI